MENKINRFHPLFHLILINLLGMLLIVLEIKVFDRNMLVLCGALCAIGIVAYAVITLARLGDSYLFIITLMLASIGVIMQMRIDISEGLRQMKLLLVGIAFFGMTMLFYRILHRYVHKLMCLYYGASMLMFAALFALAKSVFGAKNWINVMGITVQPSEFIRILLVLSLAAAFTSEVPQKLLGVLPQRIRSEKISRILLSTVIAYSNILCLMLCREWGIALLFFGIYFSFVYIYSESKSFLAFNLVAMCAAGYVGVKYMSHIQTRIRIWKDPFANPYGEGYQICRSLFAIGEGGFAGRGIGSGSINTISVVESDFIFAAICEEMGILGGIAILMLYFVLVYRGFKIALSCTNPYHKAVSMGISVMLGIQTFIIVGGVTKLIPLTGITLPFISAGGSSMITTFIALGILQAISGLKGEVTDEIE